MLPNGAIIVDEFGRTSVEDIYAAGDCATIQNIVTGQDSYVPLATGANKLGRIVGENLAGANNSSKDLRFKLYKSYGYGSSFNWYD